MTLRCQTRWTLLGGILAAVAVIGAGACASDQPKARGAMAGERGLGGTTGSRVAVEAPTDRKWAVVVGVGDYAYEGDVFGDLS
ncbi:hypothetical protein ACFL59_07070 [Planctomycetota bacterium]